MPTSSADAPRGAVRRGCIADVGLALLVLALHFPLVAHGGNVVFGRPTDDAFEVLWQLERASLFVFEGGEGTAFFEPFVYWPRGFHLAAGAQPPWWMLALAPLTRALGPVVVLNAVSLAALVAAAVGGRRLAAAMTGDGRAGAVAGVAYATAPILTIRLGGHVNVLLGAAPLPFAALAAWRAATGARRSTIDDRRPTIDDRPWRNALLAGILVGLSALGHWQFSFIAAILPAAILLGSARDRGASRAISSLALAAAAAAVTLAPFGWLTHHARGLAFDDPFAFTLQEADRFSASPDRLLVPSPIHPIWGEWSRRAFPVEGEEGVVAVSWAVLALAAAGFARRWRGRGALAAALAVAVVLALGTSLHVGGRSTGVTLPGVLLRDWVPFCDDYRTWCRFLIAGALAVAVAAGAGAARLRPRAVVLVLAIVAFEGLAAPYPYATRVTSNRRSVDEWLRAAPRGAVVEYPLPDVNLLAMYAQARHRQPLVNGTMSIHPSAFRRALPRLGAWPDATSLDLLVEWGVRYVLVNVPATGDVERDVVRPLERSGRVERLGEFEGGFPGGVGTVIVLGLRRS